MALYSCSPIQVSKELSTVCESVSCLQQSFCVRFVQFILMPVPSINLRALQAVVSSTMYELYHDFFLTGQGEQEYI